MCVCLQEKATEVMVGDELFEPFSPDHSPSMFDIFDDDLAPPLPKRVRTKLARWLHIYADAHFTGQPCRHVQQCFSSFLFSLIHQAMKSFLMKKLLLAMMTLTRKRYVVKM